MQNPTVAEYEDAEDFFSGYEAEAAYSEYYSTDYLLPWGRFHAVLWVLYPGNAESRIWADDEYELHFSEDALEFGYRDDRFLVDLAGRQLVEDAAARLADEEALEGAY